jgi:putative heme-binding domain-containing protein
MFVTWQINLLTFAHLFMKFNLPLSLVIAALLVPLTNSTPGAEWIWTAKTAKANEVAYFRTSFTLTTVPEKAMLRASCDNSLKIVINGKVIGKSDEWQEPLKVNVAKHLRNGENWIAVEAKNDDGNIAGLMLDILNADGKEITGTNGQWKMSASAQGWDQSTGDWSQWKEAVVLGNYGMGPWGKVLEKPSANEQANQSIVTLPGFKAEMLYAVPKAEQGSWVSLTVDEKGRLIAGDQEGGLFRITLQGTQPATVQKLNTTVSHAQGLLVAQGALYVVKNGPNPGLYRLRDTNRDDQYDEEVLLRKIAGGGEHGPHQVVLAPDGKSLYVVSGNHTQLPEPEVSAVSKHYQEDHLVPRMWDANGHAKGILAPGGWICQTDFDGKQWKTISIGYRNQYDIAFSPTGEAFTYDSDMEWDIGMPWYRPTRICHVTVGSEFGWRSGSGKWPSYYLDNLPATIDIGPGSPTGVLFGTGAKFPAKYQQAFYALDWTYGTLYAIHLTPQGGSFAATKESFVSGRPLPLTDALIHPQDGAMYFTVGGRKTQSALYRVTYEGKEAVTPAQPLAITKEAKIRRELEAIMTAAPSAAIVDQAWPHLGHNDRFVRFAARTVIENQPVSSWQQRALDEHENPNATLTALCALSRVGDKSLQPKILKALARVHDQGLREAEMLDLMRVYALCFLRMGKPTEVAVVEDLLQRFEPMYPSPANVPNKELCELLVFLGSRQVVPKTLQLMVTAKDDTHQDAPGAELLNQNAAYASAFKAAQESRPNRQQIAYAYALRNATEGWTDELRRQYFRWYNTTKKWRGGNSFAGFLKNMRTEALSLVADETLRKELDGIAGEMLAVKKEIPLTKGPGKAYTIEDVMTLADGKLKARNFANGQKMYEAGLCASCHQFATQGGGVGPDLTGIVNRYSLKDLLENIIEPSKIISDQYESTIVEKKNGSVVVGRIVLEGDEIIKVAENPLLPEQTTEVVVTDIKGRSRYPVSAMPPALLNSMNEDEVMDLIAFLMSGGDPKASVFQP